ncbi:DUF2156 domain-containing protein [Schumannella luteola]|uniref:Lysylphosphatidylglycerol synthetase-like protein (DUF2156 family) n=1 Tax=Schumannella luteola TaxID=472059 RepID=A0A852Y7N7_9MICO|nr:lysylphosphatidylglycerol synthetase-like protein (DUF2156 family) [Schumannella luteola]TPX03036.1 DUF2156 domain-containing protein [Schumannella luteola]
MSDENESTGTVTGAGVPPAPSGSAAPGASTPPQHPLLRLSRGAIADAVRARPLTLVVAGLLLVAALITALPGPHHALSAGIDQVFDGDRPAPWWAWTAALSVIGDAHQFAVALAVAILGLGWAERALGTRRALVALLATGIPATALGLGVALSGLWMHGSWSSWAARGIALDPLIPLLGATAWATSVASARWSGRVRVLLIAATAAVLLYSGQPAAIGLLAAVLLGLLGGRLVQGARPRQRRSRHETRTLFALATVVLAFGPLLTVLVATRYGVLSPLGIAVADLGPLHPRDLDDFGDGLSELASVRVVGPGPMLVSLLPLALMLIAARGLVAGRRIAAVVLALACAAAAVAGFVYFGVLPATDPDWGRDAGASHLWELDVWRAISTVVPALLAVGLLLNLRVFPVATDRRRVLRSVGLVVGGFVVSAGLFALVAVTVPGAFRPHPTVLRVLQELPDRFVPALFLRHDRPSLLPHSPLGHLVYSGVGPLFWVVVVLALLLLLTGRRGLPVEATDADRIRSLLAAGSGSLGFMSTWAGNRLWVAPDGATGIAYRVVAGHAVTLSDPLGAVQDDAHRDAVIAGFLAHCDAQAWTPAFYSIHDDWRAVLARRGWHSMPVAEEAVIDPAVFTTAGKKMNDVRTSVNRAARTGLRVNWSTWAELPLPIASRIDALSEEWVAEKDLPELGFTLGGVDEMRDPDVLLGVALDNEDAVLGVTSWLPVRSNGIITGRTLDVMRRAPESPNGVMEFLIAEAVTHFRESGVTEVSLSGSPLASSPDEAGAPVLGAVLGLVARTLEPMYGFRSLLRFKRKFGAAERTMHLSYQDAAGLPALGLAIAGCYLPGLSLRQLRAFLARRA